jgi:RNA 3'-terminal phosphate cyclase (ATP)
LGKPAERVADEAVDAFLDFNSSDAAVDQYLADQLLVPLAIANGESEIRTSRITPHLLTQAEVIQSFLPAKLVIGGQVGYPGTVRIIPNSINTRLP